MKLPFLAGAIAAGLVLSGCGLGGPAYKPPPPGVDAVVNMTTGLDFEPKDLAIVAGQTVEWRNKSIMDHTVSTDPRHAPAGHAMIPAGAQPFDSGDIKPGQVFRYTFTVPGTYHYYCGPHHDDGMMGTVTVRARG